MAERGSKAGRNASIHMDVQLFEDQFERPLNSVCGRGGEETSNTVLKEADPKDGKGLGPKTQMKRTRPEIRMNDDGKMEEQLQSVSRDSSYEVENKLKQNTEKVVIGLNPGTNRMGT